MEKSFLSQLKIFHKKRNHCIPDIVDLSGALFILILSIIILNSQCEEVAR